MNLLQIFTISLKSSSSRPLPYVSFYEFFLLSQYFIALQRIMLSSAAYCLYVNKNYSCDCFAKVFYMPL